MSEPGIPGTPIATDTMGNVCLVGRTAKAIDGNRKQGDKVGFLFKFTPQTPFNCSMQEWQCCEK